MSGTHSDYDEPATTRCERALVTLLGELGPWRKRVYLVGGLAPRYLVDQLPPGARAHIGTTDVDLVIALAVEDADSAYRTLETNLKGAGFKSEASFRWTREVDRFPVVVEFLCETTEVDPGRIYKPKGLGAFNVLGAALASQDFVEREIEAERLDGGGRSRVTLRVANLLPYLVLKILAFQDRHKNKDAYDLVFCLLQHSSDPYEAGREAARSPVYRQPLVQEALGLLQSRFGDVEQDGPHAYSTFLAEPEDA